MDMARRARQLKNLKQALDNKHSVAIEHPALDSFFDVLAAGRFSFAAEPWLPALMGTGPDEIQAHELLLRIHKNQDETSVAHAVRQKQSLQVLQSLIEAGLGPQVDALLVDQAIFQAHAKGMLPVSVNISVESVTSAAFWDEMAAALAPYPPSGIVFEILEHECRDIMPDLGPMKKMRAAGYRFALDDFSNDRGSFMRLALFGPCLDFVKIDGKVIRSALTEGRELRRLMDHIHSYAPGAALVAEWIETPEEARHLRAAFNIQTVQGRELRAGRPAGENSGARLAPE